MKIWSMSGMSEGIVQYAAAISSLVKQSFGAVIQSPLSLPWFKTRDLV